MTNLKNQFYLLLLPLLLFCGCQDDRPVEERYASALEKGKTTQERTNDIFLDIEFGMSKSDFFTHCTQLNRQKMIREGEGGSTVRYDMKEELKAPAHMIFSPEFTDDGKYLYAMNFKVKYDSWAPWAEEFNNLELLKDLTRYAEDAYGKGWMAVPNEKVGRIVTQIIDNRRIAMWLQDKDYVRGRFVDLSKMPEEKLLYFEELSIPTIENTSK